MAINKRKRIFDIILFFYKIKRLKKVFINESSRKLKSKVCVCMV